MNQIAFNTQPAMELPDWENRHPSVANMLNPALIALVLAAAANQHGESCGEAMPWELAYIVVPMALHRDTRVSIPNRVDTYLPNWVTRNPIVHAGLAPRANSMAPYVREGLRYGLRAGNLTLSPDGLLSGVVSGRLPKTDSADLPAIVKAAAFLGKWFASAGTPATVYAVLGVTP